jgi:tRNA threonylcarbamoyladenosine biosynthesis protein TsaE
MEIITKSAFETQKLGEKIAADLIVNHKPLIVALSGDLGSGKTTFIQGFAKGLGISSRIISPTFIIMRQYKLAIRGQTSDVRCFYHLDLYRLEKDINKEIVNLGVDDIWKNPDNIIVIEWAEKAKSLIPKNAVWIEFSNLGENERKIIINE